MVIERNKYLQELINSRHNGLVKIITGMRRCGKSFLLFRLFRRFLEDNGVANDHIVEMAFDDYAFKEFRNPDKLQSGFHTFTRLISSCEILGCLVMISTSTSVGTKGRLSAGRLAK